MYVGEEPFKYFSRCKVIRHKRQKLGIVVSDVDACRHYVRRLSSEYEIQKSLLLGTMDLSVEVAEQIVTTAHGENDLARVTSRDAQEGSALIAATSGGRGGGAQNTRNSGGGRRR